MLVIMFKLTVTAFKYHNFITSLDQRTFRQPDGGKLEACTVIEIISVHFTDNWNDVPCASEVATQYVCSKNLKRSRYFLFQISDIYIVVLSIVAYRYFSVFYGI